MLTHIDYLENHHGLIPLVAEWQHQLFGYLSPQLTMGERLLRVQRTAIRHALPLTLVALTAEGSLQGAASLVPGTITHQHLTPWVSSVFVVPAFRNQGIASALTQRLASEASRFGFSRMYLFTPRNESLYARLGWQTIDSLQLEQVHAKVMALAIDRTPGSLEHN